MSEAASDPRPVRSTAFLGRERELDALSAELEAAEAGRTSVVLVHGEAGIGKTRLLSTFAHSPRARRATVLRGVCYEGGAPPYGPWAEAIGQYLDSRGAERTVQALGSEASVLAAIVPRLRERLGQPPAPPLNAVDGRLRLYDTVLRFIESLPSPQVLLLDDLQWAEPATLDLLGYVARFSSGTLIVGGYRGGDLDLDHPLTRRLAEINRHRPCTYLLLSSLTRGEATELVTAIAGSAETSTVDALYHESAGNPFFLIELARHLQDGLQPPQGDGVRLPQSVRAAVGLRLAALPPACRAMLERAAVFTRGIEFSALCAVVGSDEAAVLDCVEAALRAELWVSVGGERYDFAHALVRHALYDQLSPSRRARLHRRLADVLEREDDARRPQFAAELARQYHASADLPGAERGIDPALLAAEQAREAHAPDEAAGFLRIALDLGARGEERRQAAITGELAVALADASHVKEATSTLERAMSMLERAGASAETTADLVFRVVSVLQMAHTTHDAIEPLLRRGIALVEDRRQLPWARLKLLERRFEAIGAGQTYSLRFIGLDRDAVEVARAQGTEKDVVQSIDIMQWLTLPEIEQLAEQVGAFADPAARLRGLDVLTMSLAMRHGAPPITERLCRDVEELAPKIGSLATQAMAHAYRASILGVRGQLQAALTSFESAQTIAKRIPTSQIANGALWMHELTAQHVAPDWSQLAETCWAVATDRTQVVWFSIGAAATSALAFAHQGATDRATQVLSEIIPALRQHAPTDFVQSAAVGQAAEAIWTLHDETQAESLLPAALALIDAQAGDWYLISNELAAARLQTILGHDDDALGHFDRARQRLSQMQQLPLLAIINHDEAVARRLLGHSGSSRLLGEASRQFARLGMTIWQARLSRADGAPSSLPDGITPREAEILRLVAAGRTNKTVAAELVLSVFTVERHLANAYRKIGVHNRAGATGYVVANDL